MQRISKSIPVQKIEYIDYICPKCGSDSFYMSTSNKEDALNQLPNKDRHHKACCKCKTIFWDFCEPHFEIILEDGRVFPVWR